VAGVRAGGADDSAIWNQAGVVDMTWLPVRDDSVSERDAVIGLKPDVDEVLRELLAVAERISDPWLLECCRLRQAQMMGARAGLAGVDATLLSELEDWRAGAAFSNRERAALSYAEQYHLDHHLISDEQKTELARYLSPREFVNFVWALHAYEAYSRVLALLDIEPDPQPAAKPRRHRAATPDEENTSGADAVTEGNMWTHLDSAFSKVYRALGRVVVRQKLIDDVTSEAIRLHNASHQGCLY
jgi:hypothetical protein